MKRLSKKSKYFSIIIILIASGITIPIILLIVLNPAPTSYALVLKVGHYENEPKIYTDEAGNRVGLFPELLEHIAKQENWKLEWVPGTWAECLARLNESEINIMVDVAYSDKRAESYDFNQVEVLNNWGIIYKRTGEIVDSFEDLEGKNVATMNQSIHTIGDEGIINLTKKWGVNCTFIILENYQKVLEKVDSGGAEIGVVNRLYGIINEDKYNIERTSILFNPSRLMFAFDANASINQEIIPIIDKHLLALKEDTNSIYYYLVNKYITGYASLIMPDWVFPTIIVAIILIVTLSSASFALNRMVSKRTTELKHQSDFEQLISDISTAFVGQTANLDESIIKALKRIVNFTNTDTGYILQFSIDKSYFNMTHFWKRKKIAFSKEDFQQIPVSQIHYWIEKLTKQEVIAVSSVEELSKEANNEKRFLSSLGIKSIVDVPMSYEGKLVGFMGISSVMETRDWSKEEINLINITGQVISSAMALQKAYDELELKVDERTRELSDANERLQELDHLKSMFIASMSHELRTPLTSIIGFSKTLIKRRVGEINDEQEKQLDIILNNANHLLEMITDIIDVSKIEAGIINITKGRYDLVEELMNLKESFIKIALKKGIEIQIDLPEKLFLFNDKRRINQILMNLIGNALKFTDEGKVIIKVLQSKDFIDISVEDTGVGIKEKDLNKLFKPFSRIVEAEKFKEGTGLGLHVSKKLAKLLEGDISVESKYGKGSTFTLSLSLKE
jgi:signal transduction histidine kinase